MANRDFTDEEIIAALITGGIIIGGAVIGTYIIAKAIESYKKGDVIDYDSAIELKREIPIRYESYTFSCEEHGTNDICPSCKKDCVICNPGDYTNWKCMDCSNDDWWYDD